MPLYDYKCPSCGQTSEVIVQGFFSPHPPKCPDCGQAMERQLSSPAVVTAQSRHAGKTCCGREERCDKPPCSGGGRCHRH